MADYELELYLAAGKGNLNAVKSFAVSLSNMAKDPSLKPSKIEAEQKTYRAALADGLVNAGHNKHYHVVEYLLSLPETPVVYPFEMVCSGSDMKLFSMYIDRNVDIHARSGGPFSSPLICAINRNQIEMVKALIDHGVNLNAIDGPHWNALDHAISYNKPQMVEFFYSIGMTPS